MAKLAFFIALLTVSVFVPLAAAGVLKLRAEIVTRNGDKETLFPARSTTQSTAVVRATSTSRIFGSVTETGDFVIPTSKLAKNGSEVYFSKVLLNQTVYSNRIACVIERRESTPQNRIYNVWAEITYASDELLSWGSAYYGPGVGFIGVTVKPEYAELDQGPLFRLVVQSDPCDPCSRANYKQEDTSLLSRIRTYSTNMTFVGDPMDFPKCSETEAPPCFGLDCF